MRSDDSIDIQQYNHGRKVDKFILKLDGEILNILNAFLNVIKAPIKRLEMNRIVMNTVYPTIVTKIIMSTLLIES